MTNREARRRLIFALDDGTTLEDILSWVGLLRHHVGMFKVGKGSFTAFGPEIIRRIQGGGGQVFLDLKFHDIPATVAKAVGAAARLNVSMLNIHALGGMDMMKTAVDSLRETAEQTGLAKPLLLAVTILTSLNDDDLKQMGFARPCADTVLNLARMAQDAGVSGVVASAWDVVSIREACGKDFLIVTPGIRGPLAPQTGDDQKRTMAPAEAIGAGADYIVLGRPIRRAADPAGDADKIVAEIARELAGRKGGK
ncbi:MAG: orotidine-5'-phosphate decarboxylase [Deltaproteobacteria bacterium]|nr:orotidine-5'-phosphate decarboxylase [Deltaproteobacteria bacterium]